jgi:hypothetical protein
MWQMPDKPNGRQLKRYFTQLGYKHVTVGKSVNRANYWMIAGTSVLGKPTAVRFLGYWDEGCCWFSVVRWWENGTEIKPGYGGLRL